MSVFERSSQEFLDDSAPLLCSIVKADSFKGYTEYVVHVQRGYTGDDVWEVRRRFSDFVALHTALQPSGIALQFPPKKLVGNLDREFIGKRTVALQNYLNEIFSHPLLSVCYQVRRFFDPKVTPVNVEEKAFQLVSLSLRASPWEIVEPWPLVGWRFRKRLVKVARASQRTAPPLLLSWNFYGPDFLLKQNDAKDLLALLASIQYAHIVPIEFNWCGDQGALVVRRFFVDGSVRDFMLRSKPQLTCLKKYAKRSSNGGLHLSEIRVFGAQILNALKFLHDVGVPYGHVHCGNIIVENGVCKLLDLENGVLGLPPFYRQFFVRCKGVKTLEDVDVYSFGQCLYEMATGCPLNQPALSDAPLDCPPVLRSVLHRILDADVLSQSLPTLADLIDDEFFSGSDAAEGFRHSQPAALVNTGLLRRLRPNLAAICVAIEARLALDQTKYRHGVKSDKMQALLNSEDGKRLRKKFSQQLLLEPAPFDSSTPGAPKALSPSSSASPLSPIPPAPPPPPGLVSPASSASLVSRSEFVASSPSTSNADDVQSQTSSLDSDRSTLLESIRGFNKTALKKAKSSM